MLRRRTIASFLLLFIGGVALRAAEPRFDITSRLIGYDLVQATGSTSTVTDLPRITVASGSEGMIQLMKEFRYPKEFNTAGKPTVIRIAYLGIRLPVYLRANEDGRVTYLLRAELCEREDPNNPASSVDKRTSSVQGVAPPGKTQTLTITAPGGRKATLEITFTPLK